ncbi:CvpA family protein [Mucilaginibacter pedocola]|uniref:SCP domain-containing protein n=1 Tax=Mucilaginibacter pedocola TaxID=1792845 RepID=A0A1S9PF46_9SPHI|nr:CvpA family protein [Mucilaginibacter pedocola]OOQ59585.1 hypothetical protein BC343_05310 [Mucilaginibacter pedocola]
MNYVTLLLILIFILSIWGGIRQGFVLAAFSLLSWVGSLAAGFLAYRPLAGFLQMLMPSADFWLPPLSFMLGVLLGKVFIDRLINSWLKQIPNHIHRNALNQLLGTIPGFANGFVWAVLLSGILLLIPFNTGLSKQTRESRLANKLISRITWLDDSLTPVFKEALSNVAPKKEEAEGHTDKEFIKLPFKVTDAKVREDLEDEMLELVNKERTKRGLKALEADPEMAVVARKHSVDMFAKSYFSHYTPSGADPFDRMKKGGIKYMTAGENIALAQTLITAHNGLMNSPGHRANILNPNYGRLGIGILDGGVYGLMITQNFRN